MKFTKHLSLGLLAVAAIGFSGCSSKMSKSDCEKADFYEIGLKDGKKGRNADRLQEITRTCGDAGVAVQDSKYTYARQVGLAEYCDQGRAESDANKDVTNSVCMQEKISPYMTAYARQIEKTKEKKAKALKDLQAEKDKLNQKQEKLQAELNAIDQSQQAAPTGEAPTPTQL